MHHFKKLTLLNNLVKIQHSESIKKNYAVTNYDTQSNLGKNGFE